MRKQTSVANEDRGIYNFLHFRFDLFLFGIARHSNAQAYAFFGRSGTWRTIDCKHIRAQYLFVYVKEHTDHIYAGLSTM